MSATCVYEIRRVRLSHLYPSCTAKIREDNDQQTDMAKMMRGRENERKRGGVSSLTCGRTEGKVHGCFANERTQRARPTPRWQRASVHSDTYGYGAEHLSDCLRSNAGRDLGREENQGLTESNRLRNRGRPHCAGDVDGDSDWRTTAYGAPRARGSNRRISPTALSPYHQVSGLRNCSTLACYYSSSSSCETVSRPGHGNPCGTLRGIGDLRPVHGVSVRVCGERKLQTIISS
jgi:hypothetical protein